MALRRRRRPIERRRRAPRAGYTLVEIVVAMLITCVMITSVLSSALSSKIGGGKNDRRLIASQAARQTTGLLKSFITGCACYIGSGLCMIPSCSITGPMPGDCSSVSATVASCTASYSLNNPTLVPPIVDNRGSIYALALGLHTIQGLLPSEFEAAPYNARVNYVVENAQTINGRPVPKVSVTVDWTEP